MWITVRFCTWLTGNKMVPYTMNGVGLQAVQEEVDSGTSIVIQEDLEWAGQCANVVGQPNRTYGLIKKMFLNI
jgi:hypothetical protein